jgi:hypothetical protein
MTDQPRQSDERPWFTGIVDEFVEFFDMIECDLSDWKPVPGPEGLPNRILTLEVDEVIEFADTATPPSSVNGAPGSEPAAQTDTAA